MTIRRSIIDGLESLNEQPALVSGGHEWTGAQILDMTYRIATALRACGYAAGSSLSWGAADLPEVLPVRLAALLLGARFTAVVPSKHGVECVTITEANLEMFNRAEACQPCIMKQAPFEVVRGPFIWSAAVFCNSMATLSESFGNRPARTAVLLGLVGFGGDAALASWSLGTAVYHQPAVGNPAKALAFLERTGADCAVLSATLLRGLPRQPAATLTDFSALRRVVYDAGASGALSAKESEAIQEAFGADVIGLVADQEGIVPAKQNPHRIEHHTARIQKLVNNHPAVAEAAVVAEGAGWVVFAVPTTYNPDDIENAARMDHFITEITTAMNLEFEEIDLVAVVAAVEQLGRTALLSMLNAFHRNGLFASPDAAHGVDEVLTVARVSVNHRPLIRRWLRVLTEQRLLRWDHDLLRAVPATHEYSDASLAFVWDQVESAWMRTMGSVSTIDYARRNAERLPDLICGAERAVRLLFPEGRTDLAKALYRESVTARYQHHAVGALVSRIVRTWRGPYPVRVLEIGAGTGATSEAVLPAMMGLNIEYLYTDVSRYFLDQAAPMLTEYPSVRFGLYDIDVAPREQGFTPNSFDVIISGGVLNAARNTDAAVGWLTELLGPCGWLVFTEPTIEEFWVMTSQAFMLTDACDGRVETESTFLSLPQWIEVLENAGLKQALGLPGKGHPLERLGHRMFAAQAKTNRMPLTPQSLAEDLREPFGDISARIEIIDELPLVECGDLDYERLQTWAASGQRDARRLL